MTKLTITDRNEFIDMTAEYAANIQIKTLFVIAPDLTRTILQFTLPKISAKYYTKQKKMQFPLNQHTLAINSASRVVSSQR